MKIFINKIMLVADVDVPPSVFDIAEDIAWLSKAGEYAIVNVETALGEFPEDDPLLRPERELLVVVQQAKALGIGDLVFNRVKDAFK